jgi:ATP-binding cassette subfamily F protein uup
LDENKSVAQNVEQGSDFLMVDGNKRHVLSYLQDFLFSPERAKEPVRSLSGGERNRLLLARLFVRPANVLVLDEPTNDLDTETLELLEARLVDFQGTVLVVSHDRLFLDNLCTSTLVFEGDGSFKEYVGGYSDWQRTIKAQAENETRPAQKKGKEKKDWKKSTPAGTANGAEAPRKLTYAERREWESLPGQIEALEQELESLHGEMADPDFFKGDPDVIRDATSRSQRLGQEVEEAFNRLAELDEWV